MRLEGNRSGTRNGNVVLVRGLLSVYKDHSKDTKEILHKHKTEWKAETALSWTQCCYWFSSTNSMFMFKRTKTCDTRWIQQSGYWSLRIRRTKLWCKRTILYVHATFSGFTRRVSREHLRIIWKIARLFSRCWRHKPRCNLENTERHLQAWSKYSPPKRCTMKILLCDLSQVCKSSQIAQFRKRKPTSREFTFLVRRCIRLRMLKHVILRDRVVQLTAKHEALVSFAHVLKTNRLAFRSIASKQTERFW